MPEEWNLCVAKLCCFWVFRKKKILPLPSYFQHYELDILKMPRFQQVLLHFSTPRHQKMVLYLMDFEKVPRYRYQRHYHSQGYRDIVQRHQMMMAWLKKCVWQNQFGFLLLYSMLMWFLRWWRMIRKREVDKKFNLKRHHALNGMLSIKFCTLTPHSTPEYFTCHIDLQLESINYVNFPISNWKFCAQVKVIKRELRNRRHIFLFVFSHKYYCRVCDMKI